MREGLHKIVSDDETIVAISTPLGHSGIGVVRLSGRECRSIADRFFKPKSTNERLQQRMAVIGRWANKYGEEIDDVLVTFFQAPQSYTGEDVLEISAHGNPLILRTIVETAREAAARLAMPGEFTSRSVANGKMDLVQAQAGKEFIKAPTDTPATAT